MPEAKNFRHYCRLPTAFRNFAAANGEGPTPAGNTQNTGMLNDTLKGYICGAASGASYGLIPLFSLPLLRRGVDFDSLLFYRYLIATAVLGLITRLQGRDFTLRRGEVPFIATLGVLFALSSILMFMAFDYMPTGLISTMFFIYPILVAIIMAVAYGERITATRLLSMALAIGGLALLYLKGGQTAISPMGLVLTFGAALMYAAYIIIVNKSRVRTLRGSKIAFWSLASGTVIFFARTGFGTHLQPIPSVQGWGLVLLLAIVPTVVSCTSLVLSVRYIGSTATSILGAMEPVTAVLCGTLVFAEPMTVRIFAAIATIVGAVLLLVAGDAAGNAVGRLGNKIRNKTFKR